MEKLNESIYGMYQKWSSGGIRKEDVHEYVDLGLPSGLLWATCNIGADTPIQFGDYYQWGSVEEKEINRKNIPFFNDGNFVKYTKYDKKLVLEPKDDAAHVLWGGKWRMPTKEDFEELINNTPHWGYIENYQGSGVRGISFEGKNQKELFIPAGGRWDTDWGLEGDNYSAFLWSSTVDESYYTCAEKFFGNFKGVSLNGSYVRSFGIPIRPVMEK